MEPAELFSKRIRVHAKDHSWLFDTSFVLSNLLNNYIFTQLKQRKGIFERVFIARALGSSAFAHLIDSFIFETIAFLGVLSFNEFLIQAGFAYILGLVLEIVLSPIEMIIQKHFGRKDNT